MLSCIAVSSVSAQNIPSHDAYVKLYDDNVSQNFYDYFRTWEPGQALSEDENFFISRVPLKKRFENANTQVDPTLTTDRKFCMWTPMGVADTYWQSLPRYVFDGDNFEITTYRTDGEYIDNRHPENVSFVSNIDEDLSRRDFTINAIAYNPNKDEIVDLFGGRDDIENKKIKAVGDPDRRFKEDALRIMRAIRFSSTLGFEIEENTKAALFRNKELLKNVSAERIFTELSKLLLGDNVFDVLTEYKEIMGVIIPELVPIFTCGQNTVWHIFDVYTHTAKTVEQAPRLLSLRLTMLLHDIGKPLAKTTDDNGVDHFKGHQKISADLAAPILKRFKISNELYDRVMLIIPIHDIHIGTKKKNIKKWLNRLGEQGVRDLIEVKRADKLGQNPKMTGEELQNLVTTESLVDEIIANAEPYSVKDLKINGFDLINLGFKGKEIGDILSAVLEMVIDGKLENEKDTLLKYAKEKGELN